MVVQVGQGGNFEDRVNTPKACAQLLRRLGHRVDARLQDAFAARQKGDALVEKGRETDALQAYTKAFGLASAAGLGINWRSVPSSVLRARQHQP